MIERGLAEAARRNVHDPHEGEVVLGIDQQAQVGDHVLHFLPFVERYSAHDLMGNPQAAKGLLERPRECGHAAEHGDIGKPVLAFANHVGNPGSDPLGLVAFTRVKRELHRISRGILGPERLILAFQIESDQVIGNGDDILGAAVVTLQRDDVATRKVVLELEYIGKVGSAPSINRLIGIAGDAQVPVVDRERADDRVLGHVGVLIFVNQDVLEPAVELGTNVRVLLEDRDHVYQQIVEIDGRGHLHAIFVELVSLGDQFPFIVAGAIFQGRGADQFVLGPADRRFDALGSPAFASIPAHHLHHAFHDPEAVGLIVDREAGVDSNQGRVLAQHSCAEAVERTDPDSRLRRQAFDTLAHFTCCLVGERERENLFGGNSVREHPRDSPGDDSRFAGAGPGQNEKGPLRVLDRFALGIRQISEQIHFKASLSQGPAASGRCLAWPGTRSAGASRR